MTDPDQILELFNEAKLRPPGAERDAFVSQACEGDAELREQVRSLLQAHDRAGEFLQGEPAFSPEIEAELARLKPEAAGDRIGCYKLLQEIGEGGFGTVWMAEQMEPVSRRVALKIIKLGMDTKEVIARFEAERQALAMMDHPNIAHVFEAGATQFGRPFFVMELVKGVPITEFCDAHQLRSRQRLELFGDVCAAINHAHQKGVIHRDIKPSNVLITLHGDKPVVKVIDFGIAKATQGKLTDKTLFTRFEQFIGTPAYMSPEQAATSGLDIDTRSDIYGLGILLYELLTGKPPFDAKSLASAGYEEMLRIIREVEPVKPSSRVGTMAGEERATLAKAHHIEPEELHRLVEPDLDWIVMKAIDKDRSRRYETANGLARDIAHFLADEPVSATPPSAGYKFRKFARRNKAALRVAAAIGVLLIAATVVSSWLAIRATRAEKLAVQRLAESEQAREEAETIAEFMVRVFRSPDPARDARTITVAEALDQMAQEVETGLAGQSARRARLQGTLGQTYYGLGLHRQAIALQETVLRYHQAASGPDHPDTLWAILELAKSYSQASRHGEALKLQEEVLPRFRKVFGPESVDTISASQDLSTSYVCLGLWQKALQLREQVLALSQKVQGREHPDTLAAMMGLADAYSAVGRVDDGMRLREEALPLERKLLGPKHPQSLNAMNNLAIDYEKIGRHDEASKLHEEALEIRRKVFGSEHPDTLQSMTNLAATWADLGRLAEAITMQEEVRALFRKLNGPEHPDTVMAMSNLAISYRLAGRHDEAVKLHEEALAITRRALGPNHCDEARDMQRLATSYAQAGRTDEALKLREEVLPLRLQLDGPEDRETLLLKATLANSYFEAGRHEEALKLREEALPLFRKVFGNEHPVALKAANNLAVSYVTAGRHDEARGLSEEVLDLRRKVLGMEHPDTVKAMQNLALSYRQAGQIEKAEALEKEVAAAEAKAKTAGKQL